MKILLDLEQYDVTIGIPVFRSVDYIASTMQSALAQTYQSIEFLIVDDCGEDGSIQVVERMLQEHPRGCHVRILKNDGHQGVGPSRNRIIDEARGRYLYFLDSDDTIEPETISTLIGEARKQQAEVVYASYEIIDKVNFTPTQTYRKANLTLLKENELAMFAFSNISVFQITVCNSLIDLEFLRQTGLRFIDAGFWEDMAFTYEMVPQVKRAVMLPMTTYHYLRRPGSLSQYQNRDQQQKEEITSNIATIDYLKERSRLWREKPYLPCLCQTLETTSFYMLCHIQKSFHRIVPPVTHAEMRNVMRHPFSFREILAFRDKKVANLCFWVLGQLPLTLLIPMIRIVGKLKKVM